MISPVALALDLTRALVRLRRGALGVDGRRELTRTLSEAIPLLLTLPAHDLPTDRAAQLRDFRGHAQALRLLGHPNLDLIAALTRAQDEVDLEIPVGGHR